jgi:FlaA1/EpsC-like NDP-sugar epimerase
MTTGCCKSRWSWQGVLVGLQLNKLYAQVGVRSKILLVQQLCLTLGVTFLWESLLSYLRIPELVLAPSIMLLGSALTLAVLLAWRMFYSAVLWKSLGAKRVLFYGTNAAALEAGSSLAAHPELGLSLAGYIDDDAAGRHAARTERGSWARRRNWRAWFPKSARTALWSG